MLIVVRRTDTDLHEYLLQRFAGVRGVKVILERRRPDRPVDERERKSGASDKAQFQGWATSSCDSNGGHPRGGVRGVN